MTLSSSSYALYIILSRRAYTSHGPGHADMCVRHTRDVKNTVGIIIIIVVVHKYTHDTRTYSSFPACAMHVASILHEIVATR